MKTFRDTEACTLKGEVLDFEALVTTAFSGDDRSI
jgi:hypothetical protein